MKRQLVSSEEIQKLCQIPIEDVAKRLLLPVSHHKSLCPFHDDHTPSLNFNVRRNTYKCFGCGAYGNTINLTRGVLPGFTFPLACRWLATEFGIDLQSQPVGQSPEPRIFDAERYANFFQHPTLSPAAQHFLFEERRLHPAVVKFCRLSSLDDWLLIPYFSQDGRLTGVQRRYMGSDPSKPRFLFPRGSRTGIYNLPVLPMLQAGEDLYIAEGPSDCWAMLSAGHKAIAIPSATALRPRELHKELLAASLPEKGCTLHVCPDRDAPGEQLSQRLHDALSRIGLQLVRHDLPAACKDFADSWVKEGGMVRKGRNECLSEEGGE